ncbi:class I SAM-dependent methyltransferase [Lignipirellula cremea]|uniref:Magnesium-protoporphyrin O-methyltransferase n=1 Tax=Lignipirellula cremea TaxID=2528010 RepID=A0A518DL26_9BACT|nr:class I SAM-dependent methyltransferase [Lignipirellula cremea]QDU92542.1 Magnesium-protoporphyrin O-methyltransferase [Lignipirellula cremea]
MDWKKFWDVYPRRLPEKDLLKQIGKTVNGVPVSDQQFAALIDDVSGKLDLQGDDWLLDLCCGNGVVTRELAQRCERVLGVDFSEPLLDEARASSSRPNIEYKLLDARNLPDLSESHAGRFTKVVMYEALAYFTEPEVVAILRQLAKLSTNQSVILLASVLDVQSKWKFFNTLSRRFHYFFHIWLRGKDPGLGKWWSRSEIVRLCDQAGMTAEFLPQDASLHTAHYRIDIRLQHKDAEKC